MDGKEYHTDHFNCWQCDESLANKRYVLREDNPYCVRCYESSFAPACDSCRKPIGVDNKVSSLTRSPHVVDLLDCL